MLSPNGNALLFSSDRTSGAGRQDLYVAERHGKGFAPARALPGEINTAADEFDATFLADNRTIVFSRAPDLTKDRIDLFAAAPSGTRYPAGTGTRTATDRCSTGRRPTHSPFRQSAPARAEWTCTASVTGSVASPWAPEPRAVP